METYSESPHESFPFSDTEATIMLRDALDQYTAESGKSLRKLGIELGYKNAVILSHMANGRVPIPLDRADDFAKILNMNSSDFVAKVLLQRHPTAYNALQLSPSLPPFDKPHLKPRTQAHQDVMDEVLRDISPKQRWLSIKELATIEAIRQAKPTFREHGLTKDEIARVITSITEGAS